MADFRPAFEFLLPHEGGFTIDSGGPTKFGISQRSYPEFSLEEIRALTIQQAETIYLRDFWTPNRYGEIISQRVASKAFDLAVNMGAHSANKLLQGACVLCGATRISTDGIIGPDTLAAVNSFAERILLRNLIALAAARYKYIAEKNPNERQDLKGWLHRASLLPKEADPVPDVTGEISM
jgi:lysozyme family protein